jgi:hypothetical protein
LILRWCFHPLGVNGVPVSGRVWQIGHGPSGGLSRFTVGGLGLGSGLALSGWLSDGLGLGGSMIVVVSSSGFNRDLLYLDDFLGHSTLPFCA